MRDIQLGAIVAVLIGLGAIAGGVLLVAGYVQEAVIARIGEPDQSPLFWYLPFLLMGLFVFTLGASLAVWGVRRFRRPPPDRDI